MRSLFGLGVIALACSCRAEPDAIAPLCAKRMTMATDSHDSLAVLLACDQLYAIRGARDAANNASAAAGAAVGISAASAGARR